jgi:dethiobiotin synthetase
MSTLLIAGTGAKVGKTVLTTALAAYWQTYFSHRQLAILKPIQTGGGDRNLYARLFALNQSLDEINPIYFKSSLAAPIAAEREGQRVDLNLVWQCLSALKQSHELVLIEGAGGLGSPLTHESTMADLAWDWKLPTILVISVSPETLSQAVANVALARQSRIHLRGFVLNCIEPCSTEELQTWAPRKLIQHLTQTPMLGYIPYLSDPMDLQALTQVASSLDIERLLPTLAWLPV